MFDPGLILGYLWPQIPATVVLIAVAASGQIAGRARRLLIATVALLPVLVILYWLLDGFPHPGDFLGCLAACSMFLGAVSFTLYVALRLDATPLLKAAAGAIAAVLTMATMPTVWIYVACYSGGDCL